jgi:tetratricopeptide (TPR) repeat protein
MDPPDDLETAISQARPSSDAPEVALARVRVQASMFGRVESPPTVGRYMINAVIGRGGMGTVYAAFDPKLQRKVALKLVRAGDDEARQRVLHEARAQAQIAEPNVVAIYDVDVHDGVVSIAMELVTGTDLRRWLHQRRSWRDIARVFANAARGLAAAHERGLVHGDFKPENVLVSEGGRAQVADFGLARLGDVTALRGGTPAYMAPEQKAGARATAASDQFAWSTSLFEALHGHRPELRERASRGPRWLREIVDRGLSVDPYGSMTEIAAAIERGLARRGRGMIALVGAVVAIAVTVVILATRGGEASSPCAAGASRFARVWNPARSAAVKKAFFARTSWLAVASHASVAAQLDAYGAAWTTGYRTSCEATHVRHEQPPLSHELRVECLDHCLAVAEALVDAWIAGRAPLASAVAAAEQLPPIADCASAALRDATLPAPAIAAQVAELRTRLANVYALRESSQVAEARTTIDAIVTDATATGDLRILAEALVEKGGVQLDAREAEARATYASALDVASRARDDLVSLDAALGLLTATLHADDISGVLAQAPLIRSLLERAPSQSRAARFHDVIGTALLQQGRHDEALAELALAKAAAQTSPHEEILVSAQIATALELAGRHAEALVEVDAALGSASVITAFVADRIDLLRRRASILGELARPAEAAMALDEGLELAERLHGPNAPETAAMLVTIGNHRRKNGKAADALAPLVRARAIYERMGATTRTEMADVVAAIGKAATAAGDLTRAREANEQAVGLWIAILGPEHRNVANAINALGNTLRALGKTDEARRQFERALEIWERALGPSHPEVAVALNNLGELELTAGAFAAALARCERALTIDEARGKDHPDLAYDLVCIGEAYLGLDQAARAIPPLERALSLRDANPGDPAERQRAAIALARARRSR